MDEQIHISKFQDSWKCAFFTSFNILCLEKLILTTNTAYFILLSLDGLSSYAFLNNGTSYRMEHKMIFSESSKHSAW